MVESRSRAPFFDRESIDNFCEKGIIGCILGILVFGPLALGGVRNSEFMVIALLEAAAIFLWIIRLWVRDQYRVLCAPISWAILAFTGYSIYLWQTADIEYLARDEVFRIITYALLFFLIVDNCNRQETLQLLALTMIVLGVALSFYATFQFFTGSQKVWHFAKPLAYKGRASGTYYNPNHLAGYLEMVVPLALAFVFSGRFKHVVKVLLGYSVVAMLAAIAFTISRGAWFSIGFALLAFFLILLRNRDYRIPALVCLVLLIAAGSYASLRSLKAKHRLQQLSLNQARMEYWKPAVQMWKESPWTGVGPNHYDWRFRAYRFWQVQGRPVYTHNDYLNTLADYGVIGLSLVMATIGLAGWGVFRTWKYVRRQNEISTKPSNRAALVLGSSIGLLAILAHSVVDFNMHIPANAITAIMLLAILTGHIRYGTERFWVNPRLPGRLMATIVLAAGACWVTWQGVSFGLEDKLLQRAEKAPAESEERFDLLQRAHALEPHNSETVRWIGEILRRKGWAGNEGYEEVLRGAITWFERSARLNKWDPYALAYWGMCLHWLDDKERASELFDKALKLDPEGSYMMALYGWHLLQIGKLREAYEKLRLANAYLNGRQELAANYLKILERRLAEEPQNR